MENKIKSIEVALKNESAERDFYLKQSEKSPDPLGREMFATIAKEEEEHYRYLEQLHKELQRLGQWPEEISVVIHDTNVKKVLDEMADKADTHASATADDKEAVRIAIDFEKRGHEFYTNLKNKADGEAERSLFEKLAALEYEHMVSLQDTLNYFENPEDWFAEHEKPHFDA